MSNAVERQPLELSDFPSNLQKHVDPDAPAKMKMMAAQGMVPAPPEQTVRLLYQLHFDGGSQVSEAVDEAIADLPDGVLGNVIDKEDHPGILDWIGEKRGEDQPIVEQLLRNKACQDATFVEVGKEADADTCDVIATNEVRILRTPQIIESLYQNPNARMATVDQLIELAQRNEVELSGLPGVNRAIQADTEMADEGPGLDDESFTEMLQEQAELAEKEEEELAKLEDDSLTRSEKEKLREKIEEGDDEDEEGKDRPITPGVLQQMSVPEKIRLATVGSRSTIKKLVQDPNRLVHMAAIESPRIKQPDVVRMASRKSLPDGVIGYIANNREWTQNYQVVKNLVFNPKTPVSDSMELIKRLRNNELKRLERSKDVPHQVSRAAGRLYKKRTGR
jgi:hypothetical protein